MLPCQHYGARRLRNNLLAVVSSAAGKCRSQKAGHEKDKGNHYQ
jgi:hypothetical protein